MKTCKLCNLPLKLKAQGSMHPKCADLSNFFKQHGGWPVWLTSRTECRTLRKRMEEETTMFKGPDCRTSAITKIKVVDAGKDRVHPQSLKHTPKGTRWALAVTRSDIPSP